MAPALYLLMALFLFSRAIVACEALSSPPPPLQSPMLDTSCVGDDNTAFVQTVMSNGQCLAPGTYYVEVPALGASGRRRDAILTGSLCGADADQTTIRFRGDAHQLYLIGVSVPSHGTVHDITLDTTCITNPINGAQTHLIHTGEATDAVAIHDNVFIHPRKDDGTKVGDCVNVVGNVTRPNAGMAIYHNVFLVCDRVGVQISRGLNDAVIADNTFSGCGQDVGSEGAGGIANLTIRHNVVTTTLSTGFSMALEKISGLTFDHNTVLGRPMLLFTVDNAELGHSFIENGVRGAAAIRIGTVAHHIHLTSMRITQDAPVNAPVITMGPLSAEQQADLADLGIATSELTQQGAASFVVLQGVAGAVLSNSTLKYTGPSAYTPLSLQSGPSPAIAPAVSVPSSGVVETGTTHIGF